MQRAFSSILFSTIPIATLGCLIPLSARSQVTPDGTTSTTVNGDGNNFTIEQGDRVGDNLFHSFDEFSVPTLGSAVFNNATDIANIFSRVTGSSISSIDGLLGANGAANLFLINPNGIIFGQNASLNFGGSFFASTADSLLFEGDTEFSAVNPTVPSLLEVSIPIGLSFRDNPGDIQYNTASFIPEGATFALVGGNVNLNSAIILTSLDSRLELGGLTNAGQVQINNDGSLTFPLDIERGDVNFTGSVIEIAFTSNRGGTIAINARNATFNPGLEFGTPTTLETGIPLDADASGTQKGDILIDATETVSFNGGSIISNNNNGIGDTGDIRITASNISFDNGDIIETGNSGQGNLGNVFLTATEDISINGTIGVSSSGIFSFVSSSGRGNSSDIIIETRNLSITDGASIFTNVAGTGNSGAIEINATESIVVAGTAEFETFSGISTTLTSSIESNISAEGIGNSGDIILKANDISLFDEGQINVVSAGRGNAGNINIDTTSLSLSDFAQINGNVFIDGIGNGANINISTTDFSSSSSLLTTTSEGNGDAGNITIDAVDRVFLDGSFINSGVGNSDEVAATGKVGTIQIDAREIVFTNTSQIQAGLFTGATGDPGVVSLSATESISFTGASTGIFSSNEPGSFGDASNARLSASTITLDGSATIQAFNLGRGNGGNVTIDADNLTLGNDNEITGSTVSGIGGNVNLQIAEDLILRNNNGISARAFGDANGGNLTIDSELIVAFPNGNNDIIASAQAGNGGQINISTQGIFGLEERRATPFNLTNDIDASSEFGLQGDFALNTPEFDPTSGLINLPASVGDASEQISQNPCQQGVGSEFIVTGKGGLPSSPTETLSSNEVQVGLVEPFLGQGEGETGRLGEEETREEDIITETVPAMGWVFNDRGEVTLTAYSNTNAETERLPFGYALRSQHYSTTCNTNISLQLQ